MGKLKSLLPGSEREILINIVSITLFLIALKKFLKGEPPKSVEERDKKVIIVNPQNVSIAVDKETYRIARGNEDVDRCISKLAEPLGCEEIENFEVVSETGDRVLIEKEDKLYLQKKSPLITFTEKEVFYERQELTVLKIVFQENRKREFIHEGRKISAVIEDEDFMQNLGAYSFSQGTKIVADLKVRFGFDSKVKALVEKDVKVVKVHRVIPPPTQSYLYGE